MHQKSRIAVLSRDRDLHYHVALHLESKGFQAVSLPEPSQVLGFVYADPPDVIVIDLSSADCEFYQVLRDLKQDSYFSVIPVIGLMSESSVEATQWDQFPIDDFVSHPVNHRELYTRILLSLQRIRRIFDNNPLTKLPGNTSIQLAIEQALGKPMAVCYIDINHFKPYNDTFGFSRGDEVLRMVGRIMMNTVKESREGGFVGHVGGDDFVFIVPMAEAETLCRAIIANFGVIASDLFDEEEKATGYYLARDRKGKLQKVPLLGISIAVVPTDNPLMQHAGKVAEVAADLKKVAKKSKESCYVIDRRRTTEAGDCMADPGEEADPGSCEK
jgi:diguanylate cyclase (GGDEF)-like protein